MFPFERITLSRDMKLARTEQLAVSTGWLGRERIGTDPPPSRLFFRKAEDGMVTPSMKTKESFFC